MIVYYDVLEIIGREEHKLPSKCRLLSSVPTTVILGANKVSLAMGFVDMVFLAVKSLAGVFVSSFCQYLQGVGL